ncbi:hypothetical protein ACFQS4_01735 [Saliphagus sp. GCM10025317]
MGRLGDANPESRLTTYPRYPMSTICTPLVNRLDEVVTEVDDVYDWYVDESDEIVQFITQSRPTKQTAVQLRDAAVTGTVEKIRDPIFRDSPTYTGVISEAVLIGSSAT